MRIEPAGHRVIVKPDPLNEVQEKEMQRFESLKASGFEVAETGDKKRMQGAVHTGVLMAIGPNAWKAFDDGIPWAKIGDRVHFAKYGGYVFEEEGVQYRLLNDEDITAIIQRAQYLEVADTQDLNWVMDGSKL